MGLTQRALATLETRKEDAGTKAQSWVWRTFTTRKEDAGLIQRALAACDTKKKDASTEAHSWVWLPYGGQSQSVFATKAQGGQTPGASAKA